MAHKSMEQQNLEDHREAERVELYQYVIDPMDPGAVAARIDRIADAYEAQARSYRGDRRQYRLVRAAELRLIADYMIDDAIGV